MDSISAFLTFVFVTIGHAAVLAVALYFMFFSSNIALQLVGLSYLVVILFRILIYWKYAFIRLAFIALGIAAIASGYDIDISIDLGDVIKAMISPERLQQVQNTTVKIRAALTTQSDKVAEVSIWAAVAFATLQVLLMLILQFSSKKGSKMAAVSLESLDLNGVVQDGINYVSGTIRLKNELPREVRITSCEVTFGAFGGKERDVHIFERQLGSVVFLPVLPSRQLLLSSGAAAELAIEFEWPRNFLLSSDWARLAYEAVFGPIAAQLSFKAGATSESHRVEFNIPKFRIAQPEASTPSIQIKSPSI